MFISKVEAHNLCITGGGSVFYAKRREMAFSVGRLVNLLSLVVGLEHGLRRVDRGSWQQVSDSLADVASSAERPSKLMVSGDHTIYLLLRIWPAFILPRLPLPMLQPKPRFITRLSVRMSSFLIRT